MAIHFSAVTSPPIQNLTIGAPNGAIIGIIGLKGAGKAALLRAAAGLESPVSGTVQGGATRRLIALGEPLNFAPVDVLLLDAALSCQDPLVRERACFGLERLRKAGTTILFASYDEPLMRRLCDEIWWFEKGILMAKGHPDAVYPMFREFVAGQLVVWGKSLSESVDFSRRRGDGRAELAVLETLGSDGEPAMVLRSGQPAAVRVGVRYLDAVESPVVGIMIRTRVGVEVYGTNTELEQVRIGACAPGAEVLIEFRFECNLCAGEYTLTAASHDPDGTPHDWIDDAVAFSVADSRYTAGVANLRASVRIQRA